MLEGRKTSVRGASRGPARAARIQKIEVLELHQEVLSKRHPDTIYSMAELASTYSA
ncbi:hypothetical protein BDP55DRAFT_394688 [Colletotrichum godetiae]|uniref:Uncharacterized protein n=1 Tax=Colletotrichum godetiae TaxID=1209918 RepID=A0AAJ0EMC8_9PEZI|nr:uncharacterized protein BDP55DRAFT_394688 [Colletotrichum godetiae]KAK1658530.1 hypothetical protein BDP55DRAFT_394688 [Colletotrichum godetiae]